MSVLEVYMKVPSAHAAYLPGAYKCMLTCPHESPMGKMIVHRQPSLQSYRFVAGNVTECLRFAFI